METTCVQQKIQLEASWLNLLAPEFQKPYMQTLKAFLQTEKKARKVIYPRSNEIFKAFEYVPVDQVKVVIVGQDPYPGIGQAHGLCFSVKPEVRIPPSLENIYKALQSDLNIPIPAHGCLTAWAKQGVLLLNSILTVEKQRPASHQGKGWEQFTDQVISVINAGDVPCVFLLWGSYAHRKGQKIDTQKHVVLKTVHPSPLSAYRGFLTARHFSKANAALERFGRTPIDWTLPAIPEC